MTKILIADPEKGISEQLKDHLESKGNREIHTAYGVDSIIDSVKNIKPDIIILDVIIDYHLRLDLLDKIREINKNMQIVVFSTYHDTESIDEILRHGVKTYIKKPARFDDIEIIMETL
jgi:DNA-binding NarL/FixJ family response regulator